MEPLVRTSPVIRQQVDQFEYLLAANISAGLATQVQNDHAELRQYGYPIGEISRPMITVARFTAKEAMEETLIRYIQRVCSNYSTFPVQVNNYGSYPPSKLFLRIQNKTPFIQLTRALEVVNSYVNSCACPNVQFNTTPHITIARNLDHGMYLNAVLDFSQKSFSETFQVTELVLLRRSSTYDSGKRVNVFHLTENPQN